jgi:hypothetical protein
VGAQDDLFGRTDVTKLLVAFHNFANVCKKESLLPLPEPFKITFVSQILIWTSSLFHQHPSSNFRDLIHLIQVTQLFVAL